MPLTLCARQERTASRARSRACVQRLHWPAFSTISLALDLDHGRVGLAVAMDEELDGDRLAAS